MTNFLRFSLVVVLVVALASAASAQNVPELIYYKFNETGGTATQNFANPGVGTNPAPVIGQTIGGTGQFGSALTGTGVASNYVNTGWNTALGSGSWTISMWLNNLPSNTSLFYLWGDNTSASFRCFLGGAAGAGNITLRGTGITNVDVTAVAPGPMVVHFVYDATLTQIRAYKNGVLAVTVPQTALNLPTGTSPFRVGAYSTLAGIPAGGLMDEFRMYNRALSDVEISATWNQSLPLGTPGWSSQTSGVATALNSVKAVSSSIVWAAGNGGVVLRTTNGGTSWTSVGGGGIGTQDLYAIEAVSATTAFVTGTPSTTSYMFRTTNGGTSWDTVYVQAGGFLNAIKMYDATNGIAMGDPVTAKWTIITTTNGGSTWVRIATEPTQVGTEAGSNNGMATLGTTHIWFCSNSSPPKVYRSTNSGATWASSNLPGTATFTAGIAFINTSNGVTGGNNGNAARSTDGGATWTAVTVGGTGAIYSAASAGSINFWETRGTTVQKSVNLGANWSQDFSDATAGTFNHMSFATSGNIANGWAVTATGKIYAYFNPVDAHDLGVSSLTRLTAASDKPAAVNTHSTHQPSPESAADAVLNASTSSDEAGTMPAGLDLRTVGGGTVFSSADTVRFRAIVKNFGTLPESTYQVGWSVDGVNQTPVNNTRPIPAGANDTLTFQWNLGVNGAHTARAWTNLASDGNRANDTTSLGFTIGIAPGDTLYTFVVPNEIILGVSKMGPSNKLVFTSGGQVSGTTTTDNRWIVTTLNGTLLDSTHLQINNTAGQGFGFRDLAWDGRWLLTSDNNQVRRIDTATFTEIATRINGPGALQRGLATESPNRIWKSDFTVSAVILFDTTGAQIKSIGIPTVAPYGIALDKWTSPSRGYLWYAQPSLAGQIRLSKVDTATGALLTTYDYSAMNPATASSGGLDIINNHPSYPGRVVAFMAIQGFPTSKCMVIDLGPDSSSGAPPTPGWTARTSGVTSFLQSVKQVNANVIWAAGNGSTVRKSTDGGATWTNGNPNPGVITGDIYNIDALDANTAFVTTSPAATFIYRTTNGGTLWTQVFTQTGGFINAIRMLSPAVGIAEGDPVGGTFTIVGTTDGGATWTRVPPANEPVPVGAETGLNNSLSTVGTTHIWFGSSLGPVWRSTNSGASWTRVATTFTGNNLEVHFNNTVNGVTGNNAGLANRSTDGGATWVATTIPGTGGVNGLSGSGSDFFASKGTIVYRSTNGGSTWASSYGGGIGTLAHLDFYASGGNMYGATVSQTGGIATAFFTVTGVKEGTQELPTVFSLAQNYPNPFNPSTTIRYALPEAAHVTLSIYNVLGQRVAELTNEVQSAGFYNTIWNSRNQAGSQVATGIYFYRIEATPANGGAPFVSLKKMVLLK